MLFTTANIVPYLLDCGLLDRAAVVDGDVQVVAARRRNRNLQILCSPPLPGLFLKQAAEWGTTAGLTLEREAACYWLAGNDANFAALAGLLPAFRHYDQTRKALITELFPASANLTEYQYRRKQFPVALAAQLGKALGQYHCLNPATLQEPEYDSLFPQQLPGLLAAPQSGADWLSAADGAVLKIVRRYPAFQQSLAEIRREWRRDSLMHGDMKWDNCLVALKADDPESYDLKIVDWELADLGDACWDVGAIIQNYLLCWVLSIPLQPRVHLAQLAAQAQVPLATLLPAIHAFWRAYAATRELTPVEERAWLARAVKYGAARMIQTAYELLQNAVQVNAPALHLLQLSLNILQDPQTAIAELLEM